MFFLFCFVFRKAYSPRLFSCKVQFKFLTINSVIKLLNHQLILYLIWITQVEWLPKKDMKTSPCSWGEIIVHIVGSFCSSVFGHIDVLHMLYCTHFSSDLIVECRKKMEAFRLVYNLYTSVLWVSWGVMYNYAQLDSISALLVVFNLLLLKFFSGL